MSSRQGRSPQPSSTHLERGDPVDPVEGEAGVAAEVHAEAFELGRHVVAGGQGEGVAVELGGVEVDRLAEPVVAERGEQGLGRGAVVGEQRADLAPPAAGAEDAEPADRGPLDERQSRRARLGDPAGEEAGPAGREVAGVVVDQGVEGEGGRVDDRGVR